MTRKAALRLWLAATLLATLPMAVPASAQTKTLRVAMHADVRTLDPFWTTQTIAAIHGMMVYDTLFSIDGELKPQPQMVEKWNVSEDRKIYEFTLRDGLKFHDGSPVTAKDVVASMNRWGKRDGAGKQLFEYTASLVASDDKTFVWTLKEPYGLLIDTLAKTGSSVPFVMREKEAMVDPFQQITEVVGSGPFAVQARRMGAGQQDGLREVHRLRAAQGAGLRPCRRQGGEGRSRRVHLALRSADGAIGAGRRRDRLPREPADRLPADPRESTPGIKLESHPAMGTMGIHPAQPPASAVQQREGAAGDALHRQQRRLPATRSPPTRNCRRCASRTSAATSRWRPMPAASPTRARRTTRRRSSCSRRRATTASRSPILHATDHQYINPANLVLIQQLRKAGFLKLDVQVDGLGHRSSRAAPRRSRRRRAAGTSSSPAPPMLDSSSPITHTAIGMGCDKAWFGWPCDAKFEEMRKEWAFAPDLDDAQEDRDRAVASGPTSIVPYVSFAQWT